MWWILSFSLLATGGFAWTLRFKRRRLQVWRDAAVSCGLQVVKTSSALAPRLEIEAQAGPVAVRIEDSQGRVVVVYPGPRIFSDMRIRYAGYRLPEVGEIVIGDELFDRKLSVEGPIRLVSALLDAETRRLLLAVNVEGRLEISGGELRLETFDMHLANHLLHLLDIARRFPEEVDVAQRLAENARQDPATGTRLHNLLVLVREFPGEPAVEALRAACSDPSPQVRLLAALALGAERRDILVELAESLEDDACSAQAIARLGRELPFERTRALLGQALRRRRLQAARVCLEAFGKSGDAAAIDVLAKVLAVEKSELAAIAALALGETGNPAAEPPLVLALQSEKAGIRVAAAHALGRAGSTAAVLPLKEAAENSRHDPELRRATRQAIAEIQSRLQGASPGQLSLDGTETGQLSLAQAEAGQLSLATDPAGQLSFPPGEPGQLSILGPKKD